MAGSRRQRRNLAGTMAMYLSEKGYLISPRDFQLDTDRPPLIKISTIRKIFGSWSNMIKFTNSVCPELMATVAKEKPIMDLDPLSQLQAKTAT